MLLTGLAILILWRLNSRTPMPVSFSEKGMILKYGQCREAIPMLHIERKEQSADTLTIIRTYATLFDGDELIDERITMPNHYRFDKPLNELIAMVFHLKNVKILDDNGKAAILEGLLPDGERWRVLAIYKGKYDLELLYPLPGGGLYDTLKRCLIEGKPKTGPDIINRVVTQKSKKRILSDWSEKLFTLDYIVNKDM